MQIGRGQSVLVVEDSPIISRIICEILKQIGLSNLEVVSSGPEALTHLRAKQYSIVISDWNMAPMSGYDLLKEIRSDSGLARVCFLMISAEPSIERIVAARKAQADSYLVKPFNADALKMKIDEAFKTRNAANALLRQNA
jgi:two-component system, chemotaxis family, chemotaxis protein CheY